MGILGDIGHFIMLPLYYLVSAVLIGWHKLFSMFPSRTVALPGCCRSSA